MDPENDRVVAPPDPTPDCEARLKAAGIRFRAAAIPLRQKRGSTVTCGNEQAVVYLGGPQKIRYGPGAPLIDCGLALALGRFESVLQEEALRITGQRVARIEHGGTYSCRKMMRFQDMVSEHSYANAIDLRSLTLANGKKITVLRHFGALDREPTSDAGRLLRSVSRRAFDEGVFSVVLTPFWDKLHRDHLHFDLARYRVDGTR